MTDVTWTAVPCALCGADRPRHLVTDVFRRRGEVFEFQIVTCSACDFVYVNPQAKGSVFDNLAGGGARRDAATANAPIYRAGLRLLRTAGLPRGAHVLDLGCATGDFLAYGGAAGCQVVGVDLNPGLARQAAERGFQVHIGDLRQLDLPAHFDAVTLWDVIEHVDDPISVLGACRQVLKPGGLVFFHTGNADFQIAKARLLRTIRPNGGPYLIPYQHVSHFDPATALTVLNKAGFQPVVVDFAATLHYRRWWKRLAMQTVNAIGRIPPLIGGSLLTNSMAAIGRA